MESNAAINLRRTYPNAKGGAKRACPRAIEALVPYFSLTDIWSGDRIFAWARLHDRHAPMRGTSDVGVPSGGRGKRTFQCFDCDRSNSPRSDWVTGWLSRELGRPETPGTE
jgi:hypothetical protein